VWAFELKLRSIRNHTGWAFDLSLQCLRNLEAWALDLSLHCLRNLKIWAFYLPSVQYRGGGEVLGGSTPPPKFRRPSKNRAKLNPIVKTVKKTAEFRTPTPQDVRKKRQ